MDRRSAREAERDARTARHTAYLESLKIDRCTGESIPPNEHGSPQYRCGALTFAGTFTFNHDCGWGGCYADVEPTRGTGKTIPEVGLSAYRHDNQHYLPCAHPGCGHARGVHQSVPRELPSQKKTPEHGDAVARLSLAAQELAEWILAGCVPELTTGHVRIMKIARCAGARAKVAVARTGWVDARGACIGSKGMGMGRVTCAVKIPNRAMVNEKIEITDYADDQTTYLSFAMAPAKVKLSDILIESGCAVVVPHHQMHNAIGEGGLNAELAGKLTGLRVDVVLRGNDLRQTLDRLIAQRH
ncbi:hypothetical protein ABZW18_05210 [Streptomyces sp. NPDC004647]|uniref:hypothetical protein n=1 Tax=Streptomyces sp. NPDC004647 TaxID=3154671 RepID=UPI0033BD0B44